jgi:hypothetical protein
MAIYQAPRRRWRIALAFSLLGLIAGLIAGIAIGKSGRPSPQTVIAELDRELEGIAGVVGVVEVEYPQAGDEVGGARGALERAERRYVEVRTALRAIDRDGAGRIDAAFERLGSMISGREKAAAVVREARALGRLLRSAVER